MPNHSLDYTISSSYYLTHYQPKVVPTLNSMVICEPEDDIIESNILYYQQVTSKIFLR